jgi:hypothetical protein
MSSNLLVVVSGAAVAAVPRRAGLEPHWLIQSWRVGQRHYRYTLDYRLRLRNYTCHYRLTSCHYRLTLYHYRLTL